MLAALASAAMPSIVMAGVRDSERANDTDDAAGIDQAVMQDAAGRMYDIYACDTEDGRKRLTGRVQAARTLERAKDPGGLGFALDTVLAFVDGKEKSTLTGGATVMVAAHNDGVARPLDLLTLDDCAAMGTAIGAIHRLRPNFLQAESYPVFSTGQIRAQLTAWIKRLRQAGHVPPEITSSWGRIIETEGLWSFVTCPVHGGFSDGDVLFSGATITAVTNWQNMQVNDPARDLAWIFGKIDEDHRNAVLAAYGRMMGSRLDDLIMLRANLWLQMEQVGEFIDALNRADSQKIIQFKAQVERLAHQLGAFTRKTAPATASGAQSSKPPSTITVGTLLNDDDRRKAAAATQAGARVPDDIADPNDNTDETDRTGSADIKAAGEFDPQTMGIRYSAETKYVTAPAGTTSETMTLSRGDSDDTGDADATGDTDDTDDRTPNATPAAHIEDAPSQATPATPDRQDGASAARDTPTIVIPLLEREERAMRDAQSELQSSQGK